MAISLDLVTSHDFGGVKYYIRPGTTDWNTVFACGPGGDEYGMANLDVTGKLIVDVGAHIGGFAIWLATRGAEVVAVEPVPDNCDLILANADLNGVSVKVVQAIAGYPWRQSARVEYGFNHDENARAHAFIGSTAQSEHACKIIHVPSLGLEDVLAVAGKSRLPDVLKLDCEGGEWAWVSDPAVRSVSLIVGEWHPVEDYNADDLIAHLSQTHHIRFSGPVAGPGGFRAEAR